MKIILITIFCIFFCLNASAADYITITAVGDIMMGTTHPADILPPEDGQGIFDNTKNYFINADIVFGNLEGPLLDGGKIGKCGEKRKPNSQCFEFKTPVRYTKYLKEAGFNVMSVANNHVFDFGTEGMKSTIDALNSYDIKAAGGERVAYFHIKGRKIAVVGFSYFKSFISHSIKDIEGAKNIISRLKKDNDIVIVSFHGGAEGRSALNISDKDEIFLSENRGNVIRFSRAVIDAGADMVIGHGPHVLRAMEVYKNKLIAYSLGNFLTYGVFNIKGYNGVSAILKADIEIKNGNFVKGKLIPVKLLNRGIPEIDREREAIKLVNRLTQEDIGTQNLKISEDGDLEINR